MLVLATNAFNLLDNSDGAAGSIAAVTAAALAVLAFGAGWESISVFLFAVSASCAGFLIHNWAPARIFMGDAGSLFLGFLLAAVAIRAGAPLPEPASLVVPLLIVALPVADTATVFLARLRHARSPFHGGRDHLSHRLAGTGMGSGAAVAALVGVQGILSGLAVIAGRQVVPLWAAVVAALVIVSTVLAVALPVRVYSTHPVGLPRALAWGAPAALVVAGLMAVPALLGLLRAHEPALAGEAALEDAVAAADAGNLSQLSLDLARAKQEFAQARTDIAGPLASAGLAYPVLSTNLDAARTIVGTGLSLAQMGGQLTSARDALHLQVRDGTVTIASLAQAAPGLRAASVSVAGSAHDVSRLSHAYLLHPVARALDRLQAALVPVQHDLSVAAASAGVPEP